MIGIAPRPDGERRVDGAGQRGADHHAIRLRNDHRTGRRRRELREHARARALHRARGVRETGAGRGVEARLTDVARGAADRRAHVGG